MWRNVPMDRESNRQGMGTNSGLTTELCRVYKQPYIKQRKQSVTAEDVMCDSHQRIDRGTREEKVSFVGHAIQNLGACIGVRIRAVAMVGCPLTQNPIT